MRRFGRTLVLSAAALCLVICVAAAWLWARSERVLDEVIRDNGTTRVWVTSSRQELWATVVRRDVPDPLAAEGWRRESRGSIDLLMHAMWVMPGRCRAWAGFLYGSDRHGRARAWSVCVPLEFVVIATVMPPFAAGVSVV